MHVAHVIPTLDQAYGGPVTSLCGFTQALQQQAVGNSIFAALRPEESISEQVVAAADAGVEVQTVSNAGGGHRRHPDLKQHLEPLIKRADVVHLHGVWEAAHAVSTDLCRRMNVPFVIRPCGMLSRYCLAQKRLKKWAYMQLRLKKMIQSAAMMHFTSELEAREAPTFVQPHQRVIEPLGIRLSSKQSSDSDFPRVRQQHNIPQSDVLLTFLGRLHPIKGLEVLLNALKRIAVDDQSLSLLICGPAENGYDELLKTRVAELGLDQRVRFTGMLDRAQIAATLKESDLFVLPSHHENFGVSALEALASGTPVIVSQNVGIACFLRDAGVGVVADGHDSGLADAISTLSSSKETRLRYAANCRNVVAEKFSWESIADRWTQHYARLIQPAAIRFDAAHPESSTPAAEFESNRKSAA